MRPRAPTVLALALLAAGPLAASAQDAARAVAPTATADAEIARASALLEEGRSRLGEGRLDAAQAALEACLALRERAFGLDHPDVATTLQGLGLVAFERGAYPEACRLYERALAIRERALGAEHADVGRTLNNLANTLRSRGDYDRARRLHERARAIWEKALGPDHPWVAGSLHNLALLLHDQGAYDEARPLYERALAIRERTHGPDHPDVALTLNNLATLATAQGRIEDARPLEERALAILEKALGPEHAAVAGALHNLGWIHELGGSLERARSLYERSVAIREKALGLEHPELALSLDSLGEVLARQGTPDAARPLHERALAIREEMLGPEHPDVAKSLHNLAQVLAAQGATASARPLQERALAITVRNARRSFAGATANQRLALVAATRTILDGWLTVATTVSPAGEGAPSPAPPSLDTGYEGVLRMRGLAGRAGEVEGRAARRAGGDVKALLGELAAAQAQLARLVHEPHSDGPAMERRRERIAAAAERCDRLALDLAQRSAGYREASRRLDLGLADVRAALRPDEAIADFLRHGDRYTVWVLGREGRVRRTELGAAATVDAAAARFRGAVLAAETPDDPDLAAAGAALRALVWDPVEAALPTGTALIYVVPDAALAAVPFAALPGGAKASFLADELALVLLETAQDLVPWSGPARRGAGALALGGIDYERASDDVPAAPTATALLLAGGLRAPAGRRFEPLGASGAEAEAVLAAFRAAAPLEPGAALRGPSATEAAFRRLAPGRRVLHLATHGFVRSDLRPPDRERPAAPGSTGPSALDRPPASPTGSARLDDLPGIDPMLLAGVALAGANPRAGGGDDDGVLTALEVAAMDLEGVDLVCLSACDSAGGTTRAGEGVLGLVRGFRGAGAGAVVASLWPVDDDAARRLTTRLFEEAFAAGRDAPAAPALRAAARALRAEEVRVRDADASLLQGKPVLVRKRPYAAPRHWAAFVAYGPVR